MKKILALATVAAFCVAQPALAKDTGFYVGVDVGTASADIDQSGLDSHLANDLEDEFGVYLDGSSDVDDSDTTYGLTVGYRFMPYLAVEGQYLDLGEAEYSASFDVYDIATDKFLGTGSGNASVGSSGFGLSVLGILPVAEVWEFYARLGMYFGDTDADFSISDDVEVILSGDESKSEEELMYGIGAGYTFAETWNVRVEYTIIQDVGDEDLVGESDVDRLVIGLNYRF